MRDTKTRGIWIWGEPLEVIADGVKTSVLFLDTEGFESIGKSSVYDDRIFALVAIMSSILIYNLPETIREADIVRLSFAVELAEEFYGRVKGRESSFQPAKLLWLIQRDFLEGKTVQEMVNEALQRVPNPSYSEDIDQVNHIRDSLALMAENSTAFSLPQPHLQRTKLCDMSDTDLDPEYVKRRDELKEIITSMIQPKVIQGRFLSGKDFSSLMEQTLEALNKGQIPSAGSVVDAFNREVVYRCMEAYKGNISSIKLPVSEDKLKQLHHKTENATMIMFKKEHFGKQSESSTHTLAAEIDRAYQTLNLANEFQSAKVCESLYISCENMIDVLQEMVLPSMAKFNAGSAICKKIFDAECIGPSKDLYQQRIQKMLRKAEAQFISNYNTKLFNWLVIFSLMMVAIGRFIVKFFLLEIASWALFIFLETYTRIFWSGDALFYNPLWHAVVSFWEAVVYSPVLDVDRWAIPLATIFLAGVVYFRFCRRRRGSVPLLPSTDAPRTYSRFQRDA
eukprot:c23835_g1_i1 orf=307-1830(-)